MNKDRFLWYSPDSVNFLKACLALTRLVRTKSVVVPFCSNYIALSDYFSVDPSLNTVTPCSLFLEWSVKLWYD